MGMENHLKKSSVMFAAMILIVKKKTCVNHIAKRMYNALMKLKSSNPHIHMAATDDTPNMHKYLK